MGLRSIVLALALGAASSFVAPAQRSRMRPLAAAEAAPPVEEQALTDNQRNALKRELEFRSTKYFFGRVDVFMGAQFKPLSEVFDPSVKDDTTAVAAVVVDAPFGMVIEESANYPGKVEVLELVDGSNAEKAGVRVGDILRGTTAMALDIQSASEEDFGFSIGISEGTRQRAFLPTDRKSFDLIMNALKSNAADNGGPGEACMVFERVVKAPASPAE